MDPENAASPTQLDEKHEPDGSVNNNDVSETPASDSSPPPEGLSAWIQVLAAFILNLNTWGLLNTFGVFQTYYQLHFLSSYSSWSIAWIGSTQSFLLLFVSLFIGPLLDRGYFRRLLWIGSFFIVVGMELLSVSKEYWQVFLTQSLLMGVGFGAVYLPAPAIVSQWFDRRAALAMGVASGGSAVGGIIYPIVFTQIQSRAGFGWATRALGFMLLVTLLVPVLFMKTKAVQSATTPQKPALSFIDKTAFTDYPYLLLATGLFFGFTGFSIVLNYIQLFAIDSSLDSIADYILVIVNAGSLFGRVVGGYCADWVGSVAVQATAAFVAAILTYILLAIQTQAGLIAYAVLFGIAFGAFTGLPGTSVFSLLDDKSRIGSRLGMTLGYVGIGVLIGNPIAGAILGVRDDWTGLIVFCASILVAAAVSVTGSRILKVRWVFNKKL
ncbi:major facilitator superfamily domain-containing protein [Xylariaceae sp. FL1019]|nr:major facilitator superfamily domain-containing protein [Xylariaceae sp. FL1019]